LDTVEVGWRPLHNLGSAFWVHFAVRVGGNGQWHAAELLPDEDDGRNDIVPFDGSGSKADEYTWTTVPVPEGQTESQFDHNTLGAVGTVGAEYADKKYDQSGKGNSNRYVHDVVKRAGGQVPKSAMGKARPRTAPGICGGGAKATDEGSDCSNK